MIDWKEFLEKYDAWFDSFNERDEKDVHPSHRKRYVGVEELEKHFLGEVVRIEKEIKKCGLNGEISKCDYLEGRLDFVKELAGVEQ